MTQPAVAAGSVADLLQAALAAVRDYNRTDLVERLEREQARFAQPECTVLVVGEFKKGKSTLVNALLNETICAVNADVATAVTTLIRYGDAPGAWVVEATDGNGGEPRRVAIAREAVAELTTEAPAARQRAIQSIEVAVPNDLLRNGLVVIDTPGVNGGLTAAHAAATLRALAMADAVVFVSDASQEYTAAELEFLHRAIDLGVTAIGVLTKVDVYPSWRKVLDLDRGHLARAGIDIDVLPLASPLRDYAIAHDLADLDEESGYPRLAEALTARALAREAVAARSAASSVVLTLEQVESTLLAERDGLVDPSRTKQLIAKLEDAKAATDRLRSGAARWQQTLTDSFGDMISNVDLDLATRLRDIRRAGAEAIGAADPALMWTEFQTWLYQRTNNAMVDHLSEIRSQAAEVAAEVARHFNVDAKDATPEWKTASMEEQLSALNLGAPSFEQLTMRELGFVAVRGATTSVVIAGMVGTFAGMASFATLLIPVLTPVAAVMAVALGRKSMKGAQDAQLKQRRNEALRSLQLYLEETELVSRKTSRDMLRRANQTLRNHFQEQAEEFHLSSTRNLEAAAETVKLDRDEAKRRLTEVTSEIEQIGALLQAGRGIVQRADAQPAPVPEARTALAAPVGPVGPIGPGGPFGPLGPA